VSDKTWRTAAGPLIENNVYAGETYDARREADAERDEGVAAVEVVWPTKSLEPQLMPPIRRVRTLAPTGVIELGDARIFDFGQNFAGWARLTLENQPAGAAVRMRSAEDVHADGSLDTASTGVFATNIEQIETYVPKGGESESYEPRFTYHGFRYVEVTGVKPAAKAMLDGILVQSDLERIGTFECSDPMLNRIHDTAVWTLVSNLHGIPTDCPAREKCGWLGDAQIVSELALNVFDASPLFDKYLRDINTTWRGELPGDVAPGKRCSNPNGHLDWGLATVLVPWHMWLYRGDDAILLDHYDSMRRFMLTAMKQAKDGIFSNGYGDWCPPGSVEPTQTVPALTTTAWFTHAGRIMAQAARRLDRADDMATFESFAKRTKEAFNRSFFNESDNTYGSQCADAMALELKLCPPDHVAAVAESLRRDVIEKNNTHHTTGIFGSRFLHAALSRNGHGDAVLALLRQSTYPSIGYLFSLGATTFWECWGEEDLDKKWGARSKNHPMQAAFVAWFYQGLGGINPSPDQPGFKHVLIEPQFVALDHVKVTHNSRNGVVASEWRRRDGKIELDVTLPVNVTGKVRLPGKGDLTIAGGKHQLSC
jgi:alpha-L-rhamnosidase